MDHIVARFESAWISGARPRIEEYLDAADVDRAALLVELVHTELELRLKSNDRARVEDYLARFPELNNNQPAITELLATEFKFRRRSEPELTLDEYRERFPQAAEELSRRAETAIPAASPQPARRFDCPHCQHAIELVPESNAEEVICPSCGSSLILDPRRTKSWQRPLGSRLGKYEILEIIGRGAFGTVYRARDTELHRLVAIKMPRSGQLTTKEDEDRFVREARAAAQLRHPGIVAVYAVEWNDTLPYLVTELVPGNTLADILTAKRFPFGDAVRLVRQVAEALQHAHEHGVIHRDLKPSNVMLLPDGSPRLMDFGLAKRNADEITMTLEGQILGTPAYMSPEQARGEGRRADARADVYSLGVILFELLTGELPFRGNVRMLLQQVQYDEAPSPRKLDNRIPRDLETITLKCLAKEPSQRYGSCWLLADDLGRWQRGEPIVARPVSPMERVWRWTKRNPVVAGMSAAIAASLILGATLSSFFAVRAANNAAAAETNAKTSRRHAELATRNAKAAQENAARANRNATEADAARRAAEAAANAEIKQRKEAERLIAHLYLDRGLNLCEQGDVALGLLWLVRCLEAMPSDEPDLEHLVRANLALWKRQARPLLGVYKHPVGVNEVRAIAFSRDGKYFAVGGRPFDLSVWDATTITPLKPLPEFPILDLDFSPDGAVLACCSDKTIRMFDIPAGSERSPWVQPARVNCAEFIPTGERLISGDELGRLRCWNMSDQREETWTADHGAPVACLALSPDGKTLVSGGGDGTVRRWNTDNGESLGEPQNPYLPLAVTAVAWHPLGESFVTAHGDGTLTSWDAASGEPRAVKFDHQGGPLHRVLFSSNGKTMITGGLERKIRFWNSTTGTEIAPPIQELVEEVQALALSPDDKLLISAGGWGGHFRVRPLVAEGLLRKRLPQPDYVGAVALSPDGARLAVATGNLFFGTGGLQLYDVTAGTAFGPRMKHSDWAVSVAFSPDSQLVAAGTGNPKRTDPFPSYAQIWKAETGEPVGPPLKQEGAVPALAFHPDGKTLVTVSAAKGAHVWNVETQQRVATLDEVKHYCCAFSSDGKTLLLNTGVTGVEFWDYEAKKAYPNLIKNPTVAAVFGIALGNQDRWIITGNADGVARIWDRESRTMIPGKTFNHRGWIRSVKLSADGKTLLTTGGFDNTARLWDVATSKPIGPPLKHTHWVTCGDLSPDGRTAVTCDLRDANVCLWDIPAPLTGSAEDVALQMKVYLGREIDADGAVRQFNPQTWNELRKRLPEAPEAK